MDEPRFTYYNCLNFVLPNVHLHFEIRELKMKACNCKHTYFWLWGNMHKIGQEEGYNDLTWRSSRQGLSLLVFCHIFWSLHVCNRGQMCACSKRFPPSSCVLLTSSWRCTSPPSFCLLPSWLHDSAILNSQFSSRIWNLSLSLFSFTLRGILP